MSDFVHLHTHTSLSPLDGVATADEYFKECSKRNYEAIAITEHGNMASVPDAYWASQKANIKYIVGCELYYNDEELKRREIAQKLQDEGKNLRDMDDDDNRRYNRMRHLTVLCKNMAGYQNLLRIKQDSYKFFYRKPRANFNLIKNNKDGLIICSGCMNGPISFELMNGITKREKMGNDIFNHYRQKAVDIALQYKELLGEDFYIELQMTGIEYDVELFRELMLLSKELNIEPVITNDAHYINEQDYYIQKIMMSIDQNTTVDSDQLFISKSTNGYFKTRKDLEKTFAGQYKSDEITLDDFNRACDNTIKISRKCEQFNPDVDSKLPEIEDADRILKLIACKALVDRGLSKNEVYIKRLNFELDRIIEKQFSSYFLICRDLVNKSTSMGMPVGPRGSAGGSLVCFLIGIHEIDPIKFNLSFDRFLSSTRGGFILKADMESDELIEE